MIALYNKDFTINYGTINTTIEAFVEEERNGLFELSFIMLNTDNLFDYIKEENIVVANANDTLLNQKFRIYMTRKLMNNRVEVFARHISFDLMYDYIDNLSFTNQSCQYALNQLFINSNFSKHYKGYSDIVNAQNYKMSMANILEAIGGKSGSILDTFGNGAELLRDNENIHILNKRGHDNKVTIEYRKNLTGFELEEDITDLVTRILPYAKYNDAETSEEITIKADYINSPLINNYSHPYIKAIDYSEKFEDGEIPTVEKLVSYAKREFNINKVDIPKQNFKIDFIPLSKCVGYEGLEDKISICDTVTIIDTRYNINTQAKVIKTVFNVLKNRYESIELGEPKTTLGDIIGSGNNEPVVGPPGPQGPKGEDGNLGDFPNSLPAIPILQSFVYGFSNIELTWSFESKIYYQYELYASKVKDFIPNTFDLIFQGQASSYMFQAKPNETWYFKVCAINTHGERTGFSNQATVTTTKIEDLSNYVENMAIGEALIGKLSLDRGWIGKLNANLLDVKGNFSVTDGNGLRTLDIDSFGNVHIKASSFSLSGKEVATEEKLNKAVKNVDVMYYLSTSQNVLEGGSWSTNAPTWVNGKYMWSKTITTFIDGTKSETSPVCIAGAKGTNGVDGIGIKEIVEQYYLSSSKATQNGGSWLNTPPSWSKGKYIWTRSKITYTDGTVTYTTPICDSSWDAINQQTSEEVFNKLTDNGTKQGLYLENDQLYINGEYINAKNLSVVNSKGKQTLKIDSSGNVDLSPSTMEIDIAQNGVHLTHNGNKRLGLRRGMLQLYNYNNNSFLGGVSPHVSQDNTVRGMAINSTPNSQFFAFNYSNSWTDEDDSEGSGFTSHMVLNYKDRGTTRDLLQGLHLYTPLFTSTINLKGGNVLDATNINCYGVYGSAWHSSATGTPLIFSTDGTSFKAHKPINANSNNIYNVGSMTSNNVYTNNWYSNTSTPKRMFYTNGYDAFNNANWNWQGYNLYNAKIVGSTVTYDIASGYNVDVENDTGILIANEDISNVDENGNVSYNLDEMIKLLYNKIHSLEKEISLLKKGGE